MLRKIWKLIFLGFLSSLFGLSVSLHIFDLATHGFWLGVFIWLVSSLIFALLIHWLKSTPLFNQFLSLPRKNLWRWFLLALITIGLLMAVLPYQKPVLRTQHTLEVELVQNRYVPETGKVIIQEILFIKTGESLPFSELNLSGWEISPEGLVADEIGAVFTFEGVFADGLIMVLPKDMDRGMLSVTWDNKSDRYNLFGYPWGDPDFIVLSSHSWGAPSFPWLVLGVLGMVGDIFLMLTLALTIVFWLSQHRSLKGEHCAWRTLPIWMIPVYAIPMLVSWSIYLLAFWPGIIPYDPLNQLSQAYHQVIYNDHPAIHTIIMQLFLSVWDSPAPIVISRYVILALVIGYGIWSLRKFHIPGWTAWLLTGLFSLSPMTSITSINLWKDVPYGAMFILLAVFLYQIAVSRGSWLKKPFNWVMVGVTAGFLIVFRHNGILPAVSIFIAGVFVFRKRWRQWLGAAAVALVVFLLIVYPLYSAFDVSPNSASELVINSIIGYNLAAYVYEEVPLSVETLYYLDDIISVRTGWNYDCYSFSRSFGFPAGLWPGGYDFLRTFMTLFFQRPDVAVKHWLCNTEHFWRLRPNENPTSFLWAAFTADINQEDAQKLDIPLESDSKLPQLKSFLIRVQHFFFLNPEINWLIWRPALYFFGSLFSFGIALYRSREKGYLLLIILALSQTASLAIGLGSPWIRYSFPIMIFGMLFWVLLFWVPKDSGH